MRVLISEHSRLVTGADGVEKVDRHLFRLSVCAASGLVHSLKRVLIECLLLWYFQIRRVESNVWSARALIFGIVVLTNQLPHKTASNDIEDITLMHAAAAAIVLAKTRAGIFPFNHARCPLHIHSTCTVVIDVKNEWISLCSFPIPQ
jgi:hypothetical protein